MYPEGGKKTSFINAAHFCGVTLSNSPAHSRFRLYFWQLHSLHWPRWCCWSCTSGGMWCGFARAEAVPCLSRQHNPSQEGQFHSESGSAHEEFLGSEARHGLGAVSLWQSCFHAASSFCGSPEVYEQ